MEPQLISSVHLWPGVAFRFCSALQEERGGDANTPFGFGSSETLLKADGGKMEVVTPAEPESEVHLAEVTSIVSGWCARRSGPRSAPRTTANMVQDWEAPDATR